MPKLDDTDALSTIANTKYDPSVILAARFKLAVVVGPDSGAEIIIDGAEPAVLVGQSPACRLRLTDRQVSRRHLKIEASGDRLHIVDLDSTNGSLIQGVGIIEAYARGGETIHIGETAIRIDLASPVSPSPLAARTGFGRVLGDSSEMRRLYPLCERLAAAHVPVIIEGETGTGKELLAEALHECGPRADGPFIVFDCTAVPANLVESDLFGHERGAFTGAIGQRKGVFELAHGGTLLIDEIGDLDSALQPKLLRALERSEIRRIGGDRPIQVNVRVLAATRRDLDREVQAGRFRDDLFHRLAVARLELPPLRKRRSDIRPLALAFCRQLGGVESALPEDVLRRWEDSPWTGNVRELRNAVARRLALGELAVDGSAAPTAHRVADDTIEGHGALEKILALRLPFSETRARVLGAFESSYVERVLDEHGGNVMRAAAASGIARRHLQRVKSRLAGATRK